MLLDSMGPSVRSALLLCMLGLAVAAVAILAAFGASRGLPQFCAALVLGEGAMFMTVRRGSMQSMAGLGVRNERLLLTLCAARRAKTANVAHSAMLCSKCMRSAML